MTRHYPDLGSLSESLSGSLSESNLRLGSIFVSLCNNIPAGKAKRKQSGSRSRECMTTAKIGPGLRLVWKFVRRFV